MALTSLRHYHEIVAMQLNRVRNGKLSLNDHIGPIILVGNFTTPLALIQEW